MPTATSDLLATADAYRDALEARSQAAVDRMTASYTRAMQRVELEIQLLVSRIEAARLAGEDVSAAWLYRQRRLASVVETLATEVQRWAPDTEETTRALAFAALVEAQVAANALATEAARVDLPGIEASFTSLNPENMATVMGHLAPTGPLSDLVASFAGEAASAVEDALVQGVLLGKGTDWIAREVRRAADIPRWRAETIARTEALRVFREASRLTYQRSPVVTGWTWYSALDRRTCPACVAMHGEEFTTEEQLDGHPRCRCAMVPFVRTSPVPVNGEEWLRSQLTVVQRAVLGPLKYDAWTKGTPLSAFVARTSSPKWGTMRRERSMAEVAAGRNPNHRDEAA